MDFKQKVQIALIEKRKDRNWLIDQITERTGMFCDSSYLTKLLNGKRNSDNITYAICEILGIERGA